MTRLTKTEVHEFLLHHFSTSIAAAGLKPDELEDDIDLLGSGIFDSLGIIEMISAVENHFKITVDFEAMAPEDLTILGKFTAFLTDNAISTTSPR
jgi:acyl carrier protein